MDTGVTPAKNPGTSPASSRGSAAAISGVWAASSFMRRAPVHAKRPLFQSAPSAIRLSAVFASGFSVNRATVCTAPSMAAPGTM